MHKYPIILLINKKGEIDITQMLHKNIYLFEWALSDIPRIDSNIVCHHFAVMLEFKFGIQRKNKEGEVKRINNL